MLPIKAFSRIMAISEKLSGGAGSLDTDDRRMVVSITLAEGEAPLGPSLRPADSDGRQPPPETWVRHPARTPRSPRGSSFLVEDAAPQVWRRVTYYTRNPNALEQSIQHDIDLYTDPRLVTAHTGWVRAKDVGEVAAPSSPRSLAVVLEAVDAEGNEVVTLNLHVPVAGWSSAPVWNMMGNIPNSQVAALELRALIHIDDTAGTLHRLRAFHVASLQESVPLTDLRAHPAIVGLPEAEWQHFRRGRDLYRTAMLDLLEQINLQEPYAPQVANLINRGFLARFELEVLLDWIRLDGLGRWSNWCTDYYKRPTNFPSMSRPY